MERSNYNCGGSRGAYNRGGGRNNGGLGSGGAQDGGRGDGGRGNNGGYYTRGGRNRNYQQQYSNQQQEQYGGGRGRGYGGPSGGRGQQTYRTRAYPRQNADLVPDRFGGDREVRTWTPVPSGQPVHQHPVAHHQVQELPRPDVRSESSPRGVEHSKDDAENTYLPITRPDRGTLASYKVKLLVNHFPVKFDPSKSILRYDVDVKQEVEARQDGSSSSRSVKKSISKSDLRVIQEKLCSEYPDQFPLLQTAYDGEKNIFSAVLLPAGTYNVRVYGRSYTCTIKYGNELNLSKLQDFLDGNAMQVPRDVLQALDVVMKANLFREKVSVGRGMYPREFRTEDDLGRGVAAYRGSLQSLKVTSNGYVVCPDYAVIPFRKRMPVLAFLKEYIREICDVNDISKYKNKVLCALKGLRVSVTHRPTNQKYIVSGLSEKATRDISFELKDLEGNTQAKVVWLTDYFQEKWGKDIRFKDIPCLKLGNSKEPNYVPMEFCVLAEDRRFPKEQLDREAAKILKDLSLLAPDIRRSEICGMVSKEYATGRQGAVMIQNFGVEVGMEMTEVDGRVMVPPKLKLGSLNGKTNIVTVGKLKCDYNLLQGKTLVAGKAAERWALIDFSCADHRNWLDAVPFIRKLMSRCKSIGVHMEEPLLVYSTDMREFNGLDRLRRLITGVVEDCRKKDERSLQIIICVMSEQHDGYKHLKWLTETQLGVMTQCCLSQNANKGNDQFLANLGMKINAKLGGSNVELNERFPHFSEKDRYMFIGADVNHPPASNTLSPSVAAVVGSVNWPTATRYAARVSPQAHRKEEIVNFGNLCLDLINAYAEVNGVKPNKIVVFRDGVSDGQFDMVLNKEMVDMKRAIYTQDYRPLITFVVAQKRHTTRLFLYNGKECGNMPPGTVVDTTVVHPVMFGFYLCSHFGGIGTSKATYYTVIWDENGFSSDEIQKLVYHMCYIFARCTKPVSLVPPVYYADRVAYRGRMYQEVVMETQSSETASFDQYLYNCEERLKDSMFFI